jgi:hypothetical protein
LASLPIEQRLIHYFMAMGATQGELNPSVPGLSLVLGNDKVSVVIVGSEAYSEMSKIIDKLLELTAVRSVSNLVYLAAPKLLGTAIDAAVFRSRGIGLLLFDERRIEEAVPPERIQEGHRVQAVQTQDTALLAEISTLRSLYLEMEKNIARLRDDVENYRESVGTPADATRSMQQRPALAPEPILAGHGTQLPSFFTNNPWLDLLSRRGRDEEPIAA